MLQEGKELHLMIIWNRGLEMKSRILEDLAQRFEIANVYDIEWQKRNFARNVSRFYGKKLPDIGKKVRECGEGPFTLVTFIDTAPQYSERQTTSGPATVNTRVFDLKKKYRESDPGSFRIHATNSPEETRRDLFLLLGVRYEEYLGNAQPWNGNPIRLTSDTIGFSGFTGLDQVFLLLNQCCRYVVLRNYEGLPEEFVVGPHGDIDLLVESVDEIVSLLGAEKESESEHRVRYFIKVAGEEVFFDLRSVGDGYYDDAFATKLIENRRYEPRGFYIPALEEYFYSLLYHALIHKRQVAADYPGKLAAAYAAMGAGVLKSELMVQLLHDYMLHNGYHYTVPQDRSVYFNESNILQGSMIRLPEKKARSFEDLLLVRVRKSRLQLYLFHGVLRKSFFRLYLSLGGIYKVDFSIGRVKDI